MKLSFIAFAAAAAALVSAPAQAQMSVVETQLDSAVVLMANEGFSPTDEPVTGALDDGEDEEFELTLEAGTSYLVVGVCDGDCSDLDLVLTDADGNEVEADREMDDVPMLALEAEESGEYVLSVQMASCSANPCYYGVRVFSNDD